MNKKAQVLVTDDEAGVLETFRMVFKEKYDVITADCGKECLRIVRENTPELVILDIYLPDIDGIEVLRQIKSTNVSLPVIIITGVGTHKTAIEALKLGAENFIAKPLNLYYMRNVVADVFSEASSKKRMKALPSTEDVIIKNYLSSLKSLNKILQATDPYTQEHSRKVSQYALFIAQELGLPVEEQEVLKETALLHDIGKMGIAEVILKKADKLDPEEWIEIRKHSQIGEGFLEPFQILHIEQAMVRHHHERYDGKGYPDHLKGEEIPLYARILAVADAYAAMTSERPYRSAFNPLEAITELERCRGTQFDPKIVDVFVKGLKRKFLTERR